MHLRNRLHLGCVLLCLVCGISTHLYAEEATHSKQMIAYVFPRGRAMEAGEVDGHSLTRILYAFANVQHGEVVAGSPFDAQNFKVLQALKRQNPSLQILVSVGGWSWSSGFSDAALTERSRARWAASAVRFIEQNHLDGLDVDWEYPGMRAGGNVYRAQDRENFTLLLKETREQFHRAEKHLGHPLILSIAAGVSTHYLQTTEMDKVQQYVDSVNLMTYDYFGPDSDPTTGHNAPLFENADSPRHISVASTVDLFEKAGVPKQKIILGVPFFGKTWAGVAATNHGLFQPGHASHSYHFVMADVPTLLADGYVRYWDNQAQVPYLYNAREHIFISYDDTESLEKKTAYVMEEDLGGVMFWEYYADASGLLRKAVAAGLNRTR